MRARACLLAVVSTLLPLGAAAQSDAELERARQTFAEGVELTQQERWAPAADRFRRVLRVRDTAPVRYNLGLSLYHTRDDAEAARHLRAAMADDSLDAPSRAEARRMLADIERRGEGADRRERGGGDRGEGGEGSDGGGDDGAGEPGDGDGAEGEDYLGTPHTGGRPFQIDLHAGFSFFGFGLATGARFGIPLMDNGFVAEINNALYLTAGVDFYFVQDRRHIGCTNCYGPGLGVPVTLQWQIHPAPKWSFFVEVGAQVFLHPALFRTGDFAVREPGYWVVFAAGASYRLADMFLITLRVGTPYSVLGVTIEI